MSVIIGMRLQRIHVNANNQITYLGVAQSSPCPVGSLVGLRSMCRGLEPVPGPDALAVNFGQFAFTFGF